jgi:hypothetical protein
MNDECVRPSLAKLLDVGNKNLDSNQKAFVCSFEVPDNIYS